MWTMEQLAAAAAAAASAPAAAAACRALRRPQAAGRPAALSASLPSGLSRPLALMAPVLHAEPQREPPLATPPERALWNTCSGLVASNSECAIVSLCKQQACQMFSCPSKPCLCMQTAYLQQHHCTCGQQSFSKGTVQVKLTSEKAARVFVWLQAQAAGHWCHRTAAACQLLLRLRHQPTLYRQRADLEADIRPLPLRRTRRCLICSKLQQNRVA